MPMKASVSRQRYGFVDCHGYQCQKPHKRAVPIRKVLKGIGIPKDVIVKTPEEFERFKDVIGTIIYPAAPQRKAAL